jgi:anti-sigma factor RsiW
MGHHKISILIVQDPGGLANAFPLSGDAEVRDSFNVQTWTGHGLRFFVIGDADKAGIQRLAQAVQGANQ